MRATSTAGGRLRTGSGAWRIGLLLLFCLPFLSGCLTYEAALLEFDSIARLEDDPIEEPREHSYREASLRYPWLTRQLEGTGIAWFFANVLGFTRTPIGVRDPSGFARERLAVLPDLAGRDLDRMLTVGTRLLFVLDRDDSPINRIYALLGMQKLLERLDGGELSPEHHGLEPGEAAEFERQARVWVPKIESRWPGKRKKADLAGEREDYAACFAAIAKLRSGKLSQERARLRLFLSAIVEEPYGPLRKRIAKHGLYALQVALVRGLMTGLDDGNPYVRECALESLSASANARFFAWLLAKLDQRRKNRGLDFAPIDPDPSMRRRLANVLWSRDLDFASVRFEKGPSGVELLAELASSDEETSIQMLARDALCWLAGRELDDEGTWIQSWLPEWRRRTEAKRKASKQPSKGRHFEKPKKVDGAPQPAGKRPEH